jgi:uncharacterized membrane protein
MDLFMILLEAFAPLFFLYYGIKLKVAPPKMGEKGLGTKRAKQSKEAWDLCHSYGSTLCIIMGSVLLVAFILRFVLFGTEMNTTYSLILIALEMVCLIALLPLIDLKLKRTFGDN